jgi:hypothetical protein
LPPAAGRAALSISPREHTMMTLSMMSLSTHHLITFCLAGAVAVAVVAMFQERRRRRGLTELLRRLLRRRPRHHADDYPF